MKTSRINDDALNNFKENCNKKAMRACRLNQTNTKPTRQLIDSLYQTIIILGEDYATLSNREFAKICGCNNMLISRHGGILAIKKAWQKSECARFMNHYSKDSIVLYAKCFYESILYDSRSIDVMLALKDYDFLHKLCVPFHEKIAAHYGDFFLALINWLREWQSNSYHDKRELYWLKLAGIINNHFPGANVPMSYSLFFAKDK